MFWEYDSRTAGRLNLDPRGNVSESPYSTFGRNPIWKWDRLGDTSVQFKPDGTLMGMVDDGKKEISGLLYKTTSNKNGKTTYSGGIQFQFNDWEQDRTAILSGNMQAIEITDEDVDKAMSFSGVQSTEAKSNRWKYIERESRPGENSSLLSGNSKGLMDYVATSPIISPAKLHIIKLSQCSNDTKQYPMSAKGYNDFDFGNFL
jgi:hypothetical protein